MQIKGEGEYSASYTIATNYDMGLLWLDTNLYKGVNGSGCHGSDDHCP